MLQLLSNVNSGWLRRIEMNQLCLDWLQIVSLCFADIFDPSLAMVLLNMKLDPSLSNGFSCRGGGLWGQLATNPFAHSVLITASDIQTCHQGEIILARKIDCSGLHFSEALQSIFVARIPNCLEASFLNLHHNLPDLSVARTPPRSCEYLPAFLELLVTLRRRQRCVCAHVRHHHKLRRPCTPRSHQTATKFGCGKSPCLLHQVSFSRGGRLVCLSWITSAGIEWGQETRS
jgi:hypothetical protein